MTREQLYSGKAKTIYKTDDPDTLITEFRNILKLSFLRSLSKEIQNCP
ncbi:Phosphoribosylaminoimidazole-succinocarboxamide synthase [Methanosarcina barkeri str. Wiesmoor]|uniref:Phosphoribosylaminoimidazole-succinocarboxamide synthase n=2 Tax=Methanosarcina barkeri TaxID=2208 RepID=A0A0E3QIN4_METBA|nr:Phosphoribosylaminoimidazole-succinocarboxamide synthase [Methanosarcina barkeri str. Wiesmoor]